VTSSFSRYSGVFPHISCTRHPTSHSFPPWTCSLTSIVGILEGDPKRIGDTPTPTAPAWFDRHLIRPQGTFACPHSPLIVSLRLGGGQALPYTPPNRYQWSSLTRSSSSPRPRPTVAPSPSSGVGTIPRPGSIPPSPQRQSAFRRPDSGCAAPLFLILVLTAPTLHTSSINCRPFSTSFPHKHVVNFLIQ